MTTLLCTKPVELDEPLDSRPSTVSAMPAMDVQPAAVPSINFDGVPIRVRQIALLRGLGYSFREIGAHFGVTPQAISLMLSRYQRRCQVLRGAGELRRLSPRAIRALARLGIRSRREARQGSLIELLKGQRNCGRKSIEEIVRWMNEGGGGESNI
jgi:hypothetical protein